MDLLLFLLLFSSCCSITVLSFNFLNCYYNFFYLWLLFLHPTIFLCVFSMPLLYLSNDCLVPTTVRTSGRVRRSTPVFCTPPGGPLRLSHHRSPLMSIFKRRRLVFAAVFGVLMFLGFFVVEIFCFFLTVACLL